MSERAAWSRKPPRGDLHLPDDTSSENVLGRFIPELTRRPDPVPERKEARTGGGAFGRIRVTGASAVRLRSLAAPPGRLRLTFAEISVPEPTCVSAIACVNKIKDGLNES